MKAARMGAAALLLSACATPRAASRPAAPLDQEFRVRIGETAAVGGEGLRVGFVRVTEDSRCPVNVMCVTAGFARVEVELSAPGLAGQRVILTTPVESSGATYGPYVVDVLGLEPGREVPRGGAIAPLPRFEAVMRVRRREARPAS